MAIRLVTCTIRIDEELLDCDFCHPAASIEEAVRAWEGLTIARWDDPSQEDLSLQYGTWGEHPEHSRESWRGEVSNEETNLGYWEWVLQQEEANED